MHIMMQRIAALVVAALGTLAAPAHATVTNITQPVNQDSNPVDCAEVVHIVGAFHIVSQVDTSGNVIHLLSHINAEGITGIGVTTRTIYRFVGTQNFTANMSLGSDQSVMTTTANFGVIGQGQAVNVFMHAEIHITISPDGP
jgi:hypothetical protein